MRESRLQRDGLFGFLTAVFVAALVRGVLGASTSAGRITVAAVFGAIIALIIVVWVFMVRHPALIEVDYESIRYVSGSRRPDKVLYAARGRDLRIVSHRNGRTAAVSLVQVASGEDVALRLFSRKAIRDTVQQYGWQLSP